MIFFGNNPQITVLSDPGTLIVYKSASSFRDSGEDKKIFERNICNELLRNFLNDQNLEIRHRPSGQPFINNSNFHISVSHSGNWFALLISEHDTVGVDIQTHTSKLSRGLDYFVNEKEKAVFNQSFSDNQLYAIWEQKKLYIKSLREISKISKMVFR